MPAVTGMLHISEMQCATGSVDNIQCIAHVQSTLMARQDLSPVRGEEAAHWKVATECHVPLIAFD